MPQLRQRLIEIVLDELDPLVALEALPRRREHHLGEVPTALGTCSGSTLSLK